MNKKTKHNYAILSEKMDKRHKFLSMLKEQFPTIDQCPEHWHNDWLAFQEDGFESWRDMPRVVSKLKKAARKAKKLDQNKL